jgi:hypothetical protein
MQTSHQHEVPTVLLLPRSIAVTVAFVLLLTPSSFAFDTPLSERAVREAYFLGQRRDDSTARLLSRYVKSLPLPAAGPYIQSVTFLTPFALLVQNSSRQYGYSAQQAAKDHHSDNEIVAISIAIQFTPSYGSSLSVPASSRSGSPGIQLRSPDFWQDFDIAVFDGQNKLTATGVTGDPTYFCNEGCTLSGAVVHLEFPAESFASSTATIQVTPPEGKQVSVEFDSTHLR